MTTTSEPARIEPSRPVLSDHQLRALLALMKASDSVELKLTIPAADHRSTIASLGIDPLDAQVRQVFFLDTPDLRLTNAGVIVRVRRVQRRDADSVVKLRPIIPSDIPWELRQLPGFGVELDAMPGGFVCSGSMKGETDNQAVIDAAAGRLATRMLFTREQRALYQKYAPAGIDLDTLTFLGPIFVLRAKWIPKKGGRPMVAEMWFYPDGGRILELSTRCRPREGFQVAVESRAYLTERGVNLTSEQETKTKKALEYFAGLNPAA